MASSSPNPSTADLVDGTLAVAAGIGIVTLALSLCDGFHRIITDVANPPGEPTDLTRPVFDMGAKADALYASFHPNVSADKVIF